MGSDDCTIVQIKDISYMNNLFLYFPESEFRSLSRLGNGIDKKSIRSGGDKDLYGITFRRRHLSHYSPPAAATLFAYACRPWCICWAVGGRSQDYRLSSHSRGLCTSFRELLASDHTCWRTQVSSIHPRRISIRHPDSEMRENYWNFDAKGPHFFTTFFA